MDIERAYIAAVEAMDSARTAREKSRAILAELTEQLAAVEKEHARLLQGTGDIEAQAAALATLHGRKEILANRHRSAEAEDSAASAAYASEVRKVQAHLNAFSADLITACRADIEHARHAVDRLPLARLLAAMNDAREAVGGWRSPDDFTDWGEKYLRTWNALRGPMEEHRNALRSLTAGIAESLRKLDADASKALEP